MGKVDWMEEGGLNIAIFLVGVFCALAFPVFAAFAQQQPTTEREWTYRLRIAAEQRNNAANGEIVNAAKVLDLTDEVKRLESELKAAKEKCGEPCKDAK